MDLERLKVIIEAETKGLQKEMDGAKKKLDGLSKKTDVAAQKVKAGMAVMAKAAMAAAAAIAAVGVAAFAMAGRAAKALDRIDKMSQQLGMTVEGFQEWDYVLRQSGTSIDNFTRGFVRLTDHMVNAQDATHASAQLFRELGVSTRDMNGNLRATDAVFEDMVVGLMGIENETQRNYIGNQLLGRSYQELIPLLNSGEASLAELRNRARELGIATQEQVIAGRQFRDALDDMRQALVPLGATLVQAFLPIVQFVIPVIQTVVGWLRIGIVYITAFFRLLFGIESQAKKIDNAVSSMNNSFAGFGGASSGGGAKGPAAGLGDEGQDFGSGMAKAAKAAKIIKKNLVGFDEINLLPEQPAAPAASIPGAGSSSGIGAGAGAGLGDWSVPDFGGVDMGDLAGMADFTSDMKSFDEQVREAMDNISGFADEIRDFIDELREFFGISKKAEGEVGRLGKAWGWIKGVGGDIKAWILDNLDEIIRLLQFITAFSLAKLIMKLGPVAALMKTVTAITFTGPMMTLSKFGIAVLKVWKIIRPFIPAITKFGFALIVAAIVEVILFGKKFHDAFKEYLGAIGNYFSTLYNSFVVPLVEGMKPHIETIMELIGLVAGAAWKLWTKYLSPAWDAIVNATEQVMITFVKLAQIATEVVNVIVKIFGPLAAWFVNRIIGSIVNAIGFLVTVIGGAIYGIIAVVSILVQVVAAFVTGLFMIINAVLDELIAALRWTADNWDKIWGSMMAFLTGVKDKIIEIGINIRDTFIRLINYVKDGFKVAWDNTLGSIQRTFTNISEIIKRAALILRDTFIVLINYIKGAFKTIWENTFGSVRNTLTNVFNTMKIAAIKFRSALVTQFNKLRDGVKAPLNGILGFGNSVLSGFENIINGLGKAIKRIPKIDIPDWVPGIGGNSFGLPNISNVRLPRIPKLADGGMVDVGQMFIAREAGPELVGNYGSKTAVMNNDQIVSSVSKGVAQAVAGVLGTGQQGGDIVIKVGNTELARTTIKSINQLQKQEGKLLLDLGV